MLRRRQIFTIFDPNPPTIGIPAKCLWRGFVILMYCDLSTIGTWGHSSPLRHADVLNGWSLSKKTNVHAICSYNTDAQSKDRFQMQSSYHQFSSFQIHINKIKGSLSSQRLKDYRFKKFFQKLNSVKKLVEKLVKTQGNNDFCIIYKSLPLWKTIWVLRSSACPASKRWA